ncbi:MAG TPA: hypothetical protein VGF97_05400 [Rhizomicrobium sp.]
MAQNRAQFDGSSRVVRIPVEYAATAGLGFRQSAGFAQRTHDLDLLVDTSRRARRNRVELFYRRLDVAALQRQRPKQQCGARMPGILRKYLTAACFRFLNAPELSERLRKFELARDALRFARDGSREMHACRLVIATLARDKAEHHAGFRVLGRLGKDALAALGGFVQPVEVAKRLGDFELERQLARPKGGRRREKIEGRRVLLAMTCRYCPFDQ